MSERKKTVSEKLTSRAEKLRGQIIEAMAGIEGMTNTIILEYYFPVLDGDYVNDKRVDFNYLFIEKGLLTLMERKTLIGKLVDIRFPLWKKAYESKFKKMGYTKSFFTELHNVIEVRNAFAHRPLSIYYHTKGKSGKIHHELKVDKLTHKGEGRYVFEKTHSENDLKKNLQIIEHLMEGLHFLYWAIQINQDSKGYDKEGFSNAPPTSK